MTELPIYDNPRYQHALRAWFLNSGYARHRGEPGHKRLGPGHLDARLAAEYQWYSEETGGNLTDAVAVSAQCECGQRYEHVFRDLNLPAFLSELIAHGTDYRP